jgi:hypothetical protein
MKGVRARQAVCADSEGLRSHYFRKGWDISGGSYLMKGSSCGISLVRIMVIFSKRGDSHRVPPLKEGNDTENERYFPASLVLVGANTWHCSHDHLVPLVLSPFSTYSSFTAPHSQHPSYKMLRQRVKT